MANTKNIIVKHKPLVLVLYANAYYPLRTTLRDHLFFLKQYADVRCFYFNVDTGTVPAYLKKINFDAIIFDTLLLSRRWNGETFFKENIVERIKYFSKRDTLKIVMPQDEWIFTDVLNEFINDFNIDYVLSVAPPTEWPTIYSKVDRRKVKFEQILTGYLSDRTLTTIDKILNQKKNRQYKIGYRASTSPPWLGKHGYLKTKIAEVFTSWCKSKNISHNISVKFEDTLYGDSWFEFLANCEFTISVEGGSTVHDPKGEVMKAGVTFKSKNTEAYYDEYEANCFKGMDGNLNLIALSPRHLEACATKTCQILIEGNYNGILKANEHYFELKKDFSNINEVHKLMNSDNEKTRLVNNAHRDIIEGGKYSYKKLSEKISAFVKSNTKSKSLQTKSAYWYLINRIINYYHVKKITDKNKILMSILTIFRMLKLNR
jgi:hypothetical protein